MMSDLVFKELNKADIAEIAALGLLLNPAYSKNELWAYLEEMFSFNSYRCFGLFLNEELIAMSSGWITVRFYCGRQLEVDNVVVKPELQSQGIGATFFTFIEDWAKENNCRSLELNTYVQNTRSHKFYFNQGHSIIGYHFQKKLGQKEDTSDSVNGCRV